MNPLRKAIVDLALTQLGKPYQWGAVLDVADADPKSFDCSCFAAWCYWRAAHLDLLRTSAQQYQMTEATDDPQPGDLGFFGASEHVAVDNPAGIYHVGIVESNNAVVEARGLQDHSSFETGKVIRRPLIAWVNFSHFKGWRRHKDLVV